MIPSTRRKNIVVAGAALALAGALVGAGLMSMPSLAQAASPSNRLERLHQTPPPPPGGPPSPKPGRGPGDGDPGQRQQDMRQQHEAYMNAVAARLGISREQLNEAMKQARIDQINQAVAEGKIDQERANRMIQVIQSGQRPGGPGGPGAGPGQGGPPPGPGQGPGARQGGPGGRPPGPEMHGGGMLAANVLGMTPQDLRTQIQAGKSLAQIAQEKGISRDDFEAKLIAAQKARLDDAVANGRMSAEQAKQVLDRFTANVDQMIDFTPGQRRSPRPGQAPN